MFKQMLVVTLLMGFLSPWMVPGVGAYQVSVIASASPSKADNLADYTAWFSDADASQRGMPTVVPSGNPAHFSVLPGNVLPYEMTTCPSFPCWEGVADPSGIGAAQKGQELNILTHITPGDGEGLSLELIEYIFQYPALSIDFTKTYNDYSLFARGYIFGVPITSGASDLPVDELVIAETFHAEAFGVPHQNAYDDAMNLFTVGDILSGRYNVRALDPFNTGDQRTVVGTGEASVTVVDSRTGQPVPELPTSFYLAAGIAGLALIARNRAYKQ